MKTIKKIVKCGTLAAASIFSFVGGSAILTLCINDIITGRFHNAFDVVMVSAVALILGVGGVVSAWGYGRWLGEVKI